MSSRVRTTQHPEGLMLMQEKISGPDPLFKLYVATNEDLTVLQSQLQA